MQHFVNKFLTKPNGYYVKGLIFERLFGLMSPQNLRLYFLIALFPVAGFSQVKLSPQLKNNFHFEIGKTVLSVSVKDLDFFKKKYVDKIVIHNLEDQSNLITVSGFHKRTLDELKHDANVLFIDHHKKAREEATLDHVNSNFNRITKARHFFSNILGASLKISIK